MICFLGIDSPMHFVCQNRHLKFAKYIETFTRRLGRKAPGAFLLVGGANAEVGGVALAGKYCGLVQFYGYLNVASCLNNLTKNA